MCWVPWNWVPDGVLGTEFWSTLVLWKSSMWTSGKKWLTEKNNGHVMVVTFYLKKKKVWPCNNGNYKSKKKGWGIRTKKAKQRTNQSSSQFSVKRFWEIFCLTWTKIHAMEARATRNFLHPSNTLWPTVFTDAGDWALFWLVFVQFSLSFALCIPCEQLVKGFNTVLYCVSFNRSV